MGNYEKAELFDLKVIEIDKQFLGESHPEFATNLDNLGTLYKDLGNYD
jgi:hypothetical protein